MITHKRDLNRRAWQKDAERTQLTWYYTTLGCCVDIAWGSAVPQWTLTHHGTAYPMPPSVCTPTRAFDVLRTGMIGLTALLRDLTFGEDDPKAIPC